VAMVCSGGSRPGVIAARGWAQRIECESPRITNAVPQSETYSTRPRNARLDLAALRHEAGMKRSRRFFLRG